MGIAIENYNPSYGYYYTEEFKVLVRSSREMLLRNAGSVPLLNRAEVNMYRYDIYRLLRSLGIEQHLHWVTAYLNGIEDPFADIINLHELRTVAESDLESAVVRKNTVRG